MRVREGDEISAEVMNKLLELHEAIRTMQVGAGLEFINKGHFIAINLVSPGSGGGGAIPSPEFSYQLLTAINNMPIWDLDRFGPQIND